MRFEAVRCASKFTVATLLLLAAGCSSDSGRERESESTEANQPAADPSSAPGAGAVVPSTGPELLVSESWVDAATNGLGIQGAFFTYQDGSGRTSIAPDATRTQNGYCVAGTAGEVVGGDFGGTYGAVAALNLQQEVGSTSTDAYDATAHGVVGFGFDIVGNTGGALRFVLKQYATHDGFCIDNVPDCASGCSVEYRIDELYQNCWTPGGPSPAATSLQALEWQITTKEGAATDFDYCIENIHAVVDASLVPAPAAPASPVDEADPGRVTY
jgi:hypothetical protein